jgi:hypothetical protein
MSQKTSRFIVVMCVITIFCCLVFVSCVASNSHYSPQSAARSTPTATTFIADGGSTPTAQPPTPMPATGMATARTGVAIQMNAPSPAPANKTIPTPRKPTHSPTSTPTVAPTATSIPTSTPIPAPTLAPMPTPVPTATPTQPVAAPTGINGNPWGFDFNPGAPIYGRYIPSSFCSYFSCIASFWQDGTTTSYVVECQDGMYSRSGGLRGSCSRHGGDLAILYSHSS